MERASAAPMTILVPCSFIANLRPSFHAAVTMAPPRRTFHDLNNDSIHSTSHGVPRTSCGKTSGVSRGGPAGGCAEARRLHGPGPAC
jgi:hypothetical protein